MIFTIFRYPSYFLLLFKFIRCWAIALVYHSVIYPLLCFPSGTVSGTVVHAHAAAWRPEQGAEPAKARVPDPDTDARMQTQVLRKSRLSP